MEQEHLHLLITEEIYLLSQDENKLLSHDEIKEETEVTSEVESETIPEQSLKADEVVEEPTEEKEEKTEETAEVVDLKPEVVEESEPKIEAKQEIVEATETPAHIETKQESPEIPQHDLDEPGEIPFAVFHSSNNASDIELLHKIIEACKLPEDQYKIFGGGFDQSVHFKKALVFVPEAKAFYTPIPYKNSEFLCSKPLDQISGDVQEKAKLWGALQKFVQ